MDSEDIAITSFKKFNMINKHHSFDDKHFDVLNTLTSYNNFISIIGGNGTTYRLVYEQHIDTIKDEIHKGKRVVTMMIGANENKYFNVGETDKLYIDALLERLDIFRAITRGYSNILCDNLHIVNKTLKYIHVDITESSLPPKAICTINLPFELNECECIYPKHLQADLDSYNYHHYIAKQKTSNCAIETTYLFDVDKHIHSLVSEQISGNNVTKQDNDTCILEYTINKLIKPQWDDKQFTIQDIYLLFDSMLSKQSYSMDDFIKVYLDKNCDDANKKMELIKQIISD